MLPGRPALASRTVARASHPRRCCSFPVPALTSQDSHLTRRWQPIQRCAAGGASDHARRRLRSSFEHDAVSRHHPTDARALGVQHPTEAHPAAVGRTRAGCRPSLRAVQRHAQVKRSGCHRSSSDPCRHGTRRRGARLPTAPSRRASQFPHRGHRLPGSSDIRPRRAGARRPTLGRWATGSGRRWRRHRGRAASRVSDGL